MEFKTPTEASVAKLWKEILGVEELDRESEFFSLGGSSQQATRLIFQVQDAFQVELPLSTLGEALTLKAMAALIDAQVALAPRPVAAGREQGEI